MDRRNGGRRPPSGGRAARGRVVGRSGGRDGPDGRRRVSPAVGVAGEVLGRGPDARGTAARGPVRPVGRRHEAGGTGAWTPLLGWGRGARRAARRRGGIALTPDSRGNPRAPGARPPTSGRP